MLSDRLGKTQNKCYIGFDWFEIWNGQNLSHKWKSKFNKVIKNRCVEGITLIIDKIMIEEYVKKRNYLNHLKQMSAIKNGHYKSSISLNKSRLSQLNLNSLTDNISKFTSTSSKFNISKRSNPIATVRNKSTEQIMKSFSI